MPLPLPPENPPSSAIQWSMDAGLVTPSATETRTGEIEVQVGGGVGPTSVGVDGGLSASPFQRFEVGVRGTLPLTDGYFSSSDNLADASTTVYDALYFGYIRYNVLDLPVVRVSPWVAAGRYSVDFFASLGVSLDAGSERIRFDAAAPIVGALTTGTKSGGGGTDESPHVTTPDDFDRFWTCCSLLGPGIEGGARWLVTPRHAVRLGVLNGFGLYPVAGWRWQGERWEASADLVFDGALPRAQGHLGYRW